MSDFWDRSVSSHGGAKSVAALGWCCFQLTMCPTSRCWSFPSFHLTPRDTPTISLREGRAGSFTRWSSSEGLRLKMSLVDHSCGWWQSLSPSPSLSATSAVKGKVWQAARPQVLCSEHTLAWRLKAIFEWPALCVACLICLHSLLFFFFLYSDIVFFFLNLSVSLSLSLLLTPLPHSSSVGTTMFTAAAMTVTLPAGFAVPF